MAGGMIAARMAATALLLAIMPLAGVAQEAPLTPEQKAKIEAQKKKKNQQPPPQQQVQPKQVPETKKVKPVKPVPPVTKPVTKPVTPPPQKPVTPPKKQAKPVTPPPQKPVTAPPKKDAKPVTKTPVTKPVVQTPPPQTTTPKVATPPPPANGGKSAPTATTNDAGTGTATDARSKNDKRRPFRKPAEKPSPNKAGDKNGNGNKNTVTPTPGTTTAPVTQPSGTDAKKTPGVTAPNPAVDTRTQVPPKPPVTTQTPPPPGTRATGTGVAKPVVPANMDALKQQRQQVVSKRTNSVVIKEPDNRVIIKRDNRSVIVHNEANRLQRVAPNARVEKQGTNNVTVIQRPNNVTIYNITDNSGQLVRRYRRDADGREYDLIDNRYRRRDRDRWRRNLAIGVGVGVGVVAGAALLNALVEDVPPPRVGISRREYIVDYDEASDEEVYDAFRAPPVDRIERRYTLDEVRATPHLRDRMRRVDLSDITFETGSWEVTESEFRKLERVARAMMRVIEANPNEVFMIEGYTDAVGPEEDNLSLSDRRAESVAVILSEQFNVPAENLTTQGYGEQYLKVETDGPERANRRVAVRRITPLISEERGPQ